MDMLVSAIVELLVLGIPTAVYVGVRTRQGAADAGRTVMGLTRGHLTGYALAIVVFLALLVFSYVSLHVATGLTSNGSHHHGGHSGHPTTTGLTVTIGTASSPIGYLTTAITTAAEEIFFRGFLAGLLIRRFGFTLGNAVQALLFLAPHTLLLAVAPALWPILPTQLIGGWLLGWLRHRSNSIWPGWIVHAAGNITAALIVGA